jgi:hypothetical protein
MERRLILLPCDKKAFLVAWPLDSDSHRTTEQTKQLVASWES